MEGYTRMICFKDKNWEMHQQKWIWRWFQRSSTQNTKPFPDFSEFERHRRLWLFGHIWKRWQLMSLPKEITQLLEIGNLSP